MVLMRNKKNYHQILLLIWSSDLSKYNLTNIKPRKGQMKHRKCLNKWFLGVPVAKHSGILLSMEVLYAAAYHDKTSSETGYYITDLAL